MLVRDERIDLRKFRESFLTLEWSEVACFPLLAVSDAELVVRDLIPGPALSERAELELSPDALSAMPLVFRDSERA